MTQRINIFNMDQQRYIRTVIFSGLHSQQTEERRKRNRIFLEIHCLTLCWSSPWPRKNHIVWLGIFARDPFRGH